MHVIRNKQTFPSHVDSKAFYFFEFFRLNRTETLLEKDSHLLWSKRIFAVVVSRSNFN